MKNNTAVRTQTNQPLSALRIVLAFVLALTLIPFLLGNTSKAEAIEIGEATVISSDANLTGTQIYFGEYNYNAATPEAEPVLWHVVATDATTATLWTTASMGIRQYDPSGHSLWGGSDICNWLNGTGGYSISGFLPNAFNTAEQSAIATAYSTTQESGYSSEDIFTPDQRIALPSVAEMGDGFSTGTWQIDQTTRATSDRWWLRSPGDHAVNAAFVFHDGDVNANGFPVSSDHAVRPALKLNLSSVLFTSAASAASGKNSVAAGPTLNQTTTPTGAIKLTVKDTGLSLTDVAVTSVDGSDITFSYIAAATPPSSFNRLSAVVQAIDGTVKYYGNLGDGTSGSATVTVPAGLATGDTLSVFIEQVNGDNLTDFASTPVQVTFAEQAAPTTPTGGINEIAGVDASMEYRAAGTTVWTAITDSTVTGLAAGSYEVRLAGKVEGNTASLASSAKTVTVSDPVPVTSTATISNGTVSGTVGQAITPVALTITLTGDTFNGSPFTLTQNGLSCALRAQAGSTTGTLTVSGTPTAASTAPVTLTIPASSLTTSTQGITLTTNADAKFNIAAAPTPAPTDASKLAKTGDTTSLALPITLGVLALAALGTAAALRAQKRRKSFIG